MKFACFQCRKVFNRPQGKVTVDTVSKEASLTPPSYRCSECGSSLHITGSEFRPPSRQSLDQWRKAELLIRGGFLFHKHAGPYPKTLSEARLFVRRYKSLPAFMEAKQMAWKRRASNKALQATAAARRPLTEQEIRRAYCKPRPFSASVPELGR